MVAGGQILNGQRVSAPMMRSVAPVAAFSTVNTTVTSSTTLVNDSQLFVPLRASAVYYFECVLVYQGGTAGSSDFKVAWSGPAGFSMGYAVEGQTVAATPVATLGWVRSVAGFAVGTNGAGNNFSVRMVGNVQTSSIGGNLQLQWAQNTSNATATQVGAGSVLSCWQFQ